MPTDTLEQAPTSQDDFGFIPDEPVSAASSMGDDPGLAPGKPARAAPSAFGGDLGFIPDKPAHSTSLPLSRTPFSSTQGQSRSIPIPPGKSADSTLLDSQVPAVPSIYSKYVPRDPLTAVLSDRQSNQPTFEETLGYRASARDRALTPRQRQAVQAGSPIAPADAVAPNVDPNYVAGGIFRYPGQPVYLPLHARVVLNQSQEMLAAREKLMERGGEAGSKFANWMIGDPRIDPSAAAWYRQSGIPESNWPKIKPEVHGVATSVGKNVGSMAADPFTYALAGAADLPEAAGRLVSAGFAANMAKDAVEQAGNVGAMWDRADIPRDKKAEAFTDLLLGTLMAASSGAHAVRGHALPQPTEAAKMLAEFHQSTGLIDTPPAPQPRPSQDVLPSSASGASSASGSSSAANASSAAEASSATGGPNARGASGASISSSSSSSASAKPQPNGLSPESAQAVVARIMDAPPAMRSELLLETHDRLARGMAERGGFVGADGKLHLVENKAQARELARQFINDRIEAHQAEAARGEAASRKLEATEALEARAARAEVDAESMGDASSSSASSPLQEMPPMGRGMTADSEAVEKVRDEADIVPGQEPLVMVKDERPQDAAKLAEPPKPVRADDLSQVGKADRESGRTIVQPSGGVLQNERMASQASPELATKLSEIASSVPGARLDRLRPQKNLERITEKEDAHKPPETIADYLAAQITVDSPQAKDRIVAGLRRNFRVLGVEDNFTTGDPELRNYPSAKIQVQLSNGHTAEVQVVPVEMQAVTDQAHHFYSEGRKAEAAGDIAARDAAWAKAEEINTRALEEAKANWRAQGWDEAAGQPPDFDEPGSDQLSLWDKETSASDHALFASPSAGTGGPIQADYMPPEGVRPPILILSTQAINLFADAAHIRRFHGVSATPVALRKAAYDLVENARGLDKVQYQYIKEFAQKLVGASLDAKEKGVILIEENPKYPTWLEEFFHSLQRGLRGSLKEHLPTQVVDELFNHPVAKLFRERMFKGTYYETLPDWSQVVEIAAKIASGNHRVPKSQTKLWFREYFDHLKARYGSKEIARRSAEMYYVARESYVRSQEAFKTRQSGALQRQSGAGGQQFEPPGEGVSGRAAGPPKSGGGNREGARGDRGGTESDGE